MQRAKLVAPTQMIVEEAQDPQPGPGEVRLAIEVCGVCGSDIHAYYGEHPYIPLPVAPGHEFAGRIEALGEGVTGWQVGQRVSAEPSLVCGQCENCQCGLYNICDNLKVIGCQTDGGMAEYLVVPARKLIELADNMTWEQGAFIEPLAVGVHAIRLANVTRDSRLLILGAGTIGLMHLMVARAWGLREIVVTDLIPRKLDLALELGATHAVDVSRQRLTDFCHASYGETHAFDVAVECVGTRGTVESGLPVLKKGSTMVIAGVFPRPVEVDLGLVQDRELKLIGSLMYRWDDFTEARDLLASGRARVEPLISSRWPLSEVPAAMKAIDERPELNIKTMIHVRPQK